jgi:hypothetical protein
MLHFIYLDKAERPESLQHLIYYGGVADIRKSFCNYLEHDYYFDGENHLRRELPARFLKERYDVEWFDDYIITFPSKDGNERVKASPTCLDTAVQLAVDLVYLSTCTTCSIVFNQFVPRFGDLLWISKNCADLTIYVSDDRTLYLNRHSEAEMCLANEAGLFDFCFRGKHYNCSFLDFQKIAGR